MIIPDDTEGGAVDMEEEIVLENLGS